MSPGEQAVIVHCPKCGGRDVRHSSPSGTLAAFMSLFGLKPFRCRSCRHRFFRRRAHDAGAVAPLDQAHPGRKT